MDIAVIILFIIICILAYVLYIYYTPTTITSGVVPLANTNTIAAVDIVSPTASSYHYDLWIFVNGGSADGAFAPIFSHGKLSVGLTATQLKICYLGEGAAAAATYTDIIVHDDFPLQKWMFINLVINDNIMEFYLNGKLVKTKQLTATEMAAIAHTKNDTITYGNARLSGHITRFTRLAEKITSDEVWAKYLTGNGISGSAQTSGKYGVALEIERNNQPFGSYKMI